MNSTPRTFLLRRDVGTVEFTTPDERRYGITRCPGRGGRCLGEPVGVVNTEHARWQDTAQRSRS
ncbi:MAG: hypothetical protein WCF33_10120 [Pseudonocardiaceae bacterium]